MQRRPRTVADRVCYVKRFLAGRRTVSSENIRSYLESVKSPHLYGHTVKALKLFFRDYLEAPGLVASFRFPHQRFKPRYLPTKPELRRFYDSLGSLKERALFLLYASSGLRRREILSLRRGDVDMDKRMLKPSDHGSSSKHVWVSFFNEEAETVLREYLALRSDGGQRLIPMARATERRLFRSAVEKMGLHITPQVLRFWFCNELGRLGVADRYIDAFCGRVPRTVLANHYTDYSPERLKEIYDRAGLRVLS